MVPSWGITSGMNFAAFKCPADHSGVQPLWPRLSSSSQLLDEQFCWLPGANPITGWHLPIRLRTPTRSVSSLPPFPASARLRGRFSFWTSARIASTTAFSAPTKRWQRPSARCSCRLHRWRSRLFLCRRTFRSSTNGILAGLLSRSSEPRSTTTIFPWRS